MTPPVQSGPALAIVGPSLTVSAHCGKCSHLRSEYYCIEDGNDVDSGFNRTCMHPEGKGATEPIPPVWCPEMGAARLAMARSMVAEGPFPHAGDAWFDAWAQSRGEESSR